MFEFLGGIVSGGWNALDNIITGIGKGASTLVSGFFPTPQRESVVSEIAAPMGGTGLTYRPTQAEAQSIWQTQLMAAEQWLNSPYEQQYSVPAKIEESKGLEASISTGTGTIKGLLSGVLEASKKVMGEAVSYKTLVDEFMEIWGLKKSEVEQGTPRAGAPEGQDVQYLQDVRDKVADVVTVGKSILGGMLEQAKGLFGLGYESPTGSQPVFAIQHEIEPTQKTWLMVAVILGVIVVLWALGRKK